MTPSETLPRRAFLGAHLPDDASAFSPDGTLIADVVPGSMAAAANMGPGDRLVELAGLPVTSLTGLRAALRAAGRRSRVDVVFVRDGNRHSETVTAQPHPAEMIPGHEVFYGDIERDGVRLRTISTRPTQGVLRGAVMLIQGIACESVDYASSFDIPMAQLLLGWADAGYATLRMDKRGIGDSEGCACNQLDFTTELEDVRCALAVLDAEVRAAGLPLFVFGHSVGGMMTAELAADIKLDGAMVYGTSTMKWLDCIAATTERQWRMRGASEQQVQARLAELRDGVDRDGLNGRCPAYHEQLHALDLDAAWRRADIDHVLVMRGEHDWVVSPEEQARIVDIVGANRGELVDLPGLDHVLGWHPSQQHSMDDYGGGRTDPAIVNRSLEWMRSLPLHSKP